MSRFKKRRGSYNPINNQLSSSRSARSTLHSNVWLTCDVSNPTHTISNYSFGNETILFLNAHVVLDMITPGLVRACYAGARCRLAHCSSANASRGLTWCQRTETLVTISPAGWSRGFSSGAEATVTGSVPEVVSSTQIGVLPQTTATITTAELAASPLPDVLALETSNQARWMADAVSAADHLPAQGDLASMGLGGYGPVGILQTALDVLHTHTSLPWWAAIAASTVILRLALFPLGVRLQANSVRLNNVRPEAEAIMQKVREHNQAGNTALASQQTARLYSLYQQHKCNPFKMMVMPLVQLPIFISFFVGELFY